MENLTETILATIRKKEHSLFKAFESDITYGFTIKTKSGKTVYETNKKHYIDFRIESKNVINVLSSRVAETLLHNSTKFKKKCNNIQKSKVAIKKVNSPTHEYFCDELQYCQLEDLSNDYFIIDVDTDDDLKIYFENRKKSYKQICDAFNIDTEEFMYSEIFTCRAILYNQFKHLQGMQHVTFDELKYLDGSSQGGILYADKGIHKNMFKYDINSMYGFMMKHPEFYFPLREGKITTIKEIDKSKYGIYKLKIIGSYVFFRNTPDDYYTTYHIMLLDYLAMKYELVLENDNAIIYDDVMAGKDIFGDMMDKLFELKRNGNPHSKSVMNCSWGTASKKKKYEIPIEDIKEGDPRIHLINDVDYFNGTVTLFSDSHPFKHATGRIKAFLLSFCRYFIVKYILSEVKQVRKSKIVQVNTDGFVCNLPPHKISLLYPISTEFGHLKFEEQYNEVDIKHVRKIVKIN